MLPSQQTITPASGNQPENLRDTTFSRSPLDTPIQGWNPRTLDVLSDLIRNGCFAGQPVAFDCDNTFLRHDCGEATFGKLFELWMISHQSMPKSLQELHGVKVSDFSSPVEFYQKFRSSVGPEVDPGVATRDLYKWVVQIMEGLTPHDVIRAAQEALFESLKLEPYFPRPECNQIVTQLVAALQVAGAQVFIVSASNPWSVRFFAKEVLAPKLIEFGGSPIAPENIIGLGVQLIRPGGSLVNDYDLVREDKKYAALDPQTLASLTLSDTLSPILPAFEGKVEACQKLFGPAAPLLVAGDSRNDLPMLQTAQYRLWVGGNPLPAQAADNGVWLMQPY